jgi:hypothetical protein
MRAVFLTFRRNLLPSRSHVLNLLTSVLKMVAKYPSETTVKEATSTLKLNQHQHWITKVALHQWIWQIVTHRMLKGKQCTYNVKLRRVRATTVEWKSNEYYIIWVCVCSIRYPACNAQAPYCHLWPFRLYNIFFTLSHKQHDLRERNLLNIKCVLIFSRRFFFWYFTHSTKKWARYDKTCIYVFIWSIRYSYQILMKLELSLQIFEQNSNIKLHENTSSGSRVFPRGRTDGETRRRQ